MTAPRPLRTALALVTAALLLTGCGEQQPPAETPVARTAVGGYSLSTVITGSSIAANPAGESSRVQTDLFLSCADASCSTLLQRAARTGSPQGATVLLSPRPGGFGGAHVRAGPCGGTTDGSFGESYSWTWTRHDDGTLSGSLHQVFKGCGLDGTTTFEATATPEPGLGLPYLGTAAGRRLVKAINGYDTELSKVYVSGSECNANPSTTTVAEAHCFARTYAAWRPDIDRLASRTADLDHGPGACASTLRSVRFRPWSAAVDAAVRAYEAAHDAASVKAGLTAEDRATTTATAQQALLVAVAAMCVNPVDAALLGTRGELEIDPTSVLQPLAG